MEITLINYPYSTITKTNHTDINVNWYHSIIPNTQNITEKYAILSHNQMPCLLYNCLLQTLDSSNQKEKKKKKCDVDGVRPVICRRENLISPEHVRRTIYMLAHSADGLKT
jgi:hypothetical protein